MLDLLGNAGARVGDRDDERPVGLVADDLDDELPAAAAHGLRGIAREVVHHAEDLGLVEARGPPLLDVDDELDAAPREVGLELLANLLEELLQVHLANQDALFAARELQDLALHRPDVIELLQNQLAVLLALRARLLKDELHELDVPAHDGKRRLEVVDDARQEAPDRREALLVLARLAGELKADGRRRVGRDQARGAAGLRR